MNLRKIGFSKRARFLAFKLCLVACVITAGSFYHVHPSCSAAPATPCDPEYMDALEARAWLEAQREISQNQNLIYKPDSVMEYSCFDQFLNEAASNPDGHRQFSETDRWDGRPDGFTEQTTDDALTEVVLLPLLAYLDMNFDSPEFNAGKYMNNRTSFEYGAEERVSGNRDYNCGEMQKVWKFARCANFIGQESHDGFYDFAYYASHEVRRETDQWELMCPEQPSDRIDRARTTAFNEDQALFDVTTEITQVGGNQQPYKEDDVVTHLNHILPGNCDLCIPTGICVERPDLGRFMEQVCTNPGCPAKQGTGCGGGGGGAAP